jgi:hypothetical protein
VIHHPGDLGGFNAELRWYPKQDLFFIVLSNARSAGRAEREVATRTWNALLLREPLPEVPTVVERGSGIPSGGDYSLPNREGRIRLTFRGETALAGATDAAAIALLTNAPVDSAERSDRLSATAVEVARGLFKGDAEPLRAVLHPAVPESSVPEIVAEAESYLEQLGPVQTVRDLGTVLLGPGTARTFLRIRFAKGERDVIYSWSGDRIIGFGSAGESGVHVRFLPIAAGGLANVDPFTGRTITIRCEERDRCERITVHGSNRSGELIRSLPTVESRMN